ncbi:NUDIX hydrolase [Aquabacterium sp. J223]|uniref:NUDIX domain-containing protein n=1 Tax=Aquabacterium sp. J223 TaxID=2898431 RepID=UPI0021AD7654|nr:NUDIX hydrolase [Aquabacterium sp. J223]UUX94729.1 NUDIX hydrolase [Aquabacterium sp. J223]
MSDPEIQTVSSREVYRNRWISVREDRIRRADGSDGLYSVVDKKDFAVIAAVQDGRVWLVEQYRYPVRGRFWELPQGTWDRDTVDPEGLARAELREETGLEAEHLQHAGRLCLAYGLTPQAYDIFLATGLTEHPPQREPEEQGLIARAVPLAELDAMMRDGRLVDATTVAVMGLLRLKGLLAD